MTKQAKQFKPTKQNAKLVADILKLADIAACAEINADDKNSDFIVKLHDGCKALEKHARKFVLNSVLEQVETTKAKWVKALINKLLSQEGELETFLKSNPNKTAAEFIKGQKLGIKRNAEKFQPRKREPKPDTKIKVKLQPVHEIEIVREEIRDALSSLDYLDQEKTSKALQTFIETLTKLHYADSAENVLGKSAETPTATLHKAS
tara:strand:- start:1075 stop:1692 length:618 start_codon:yes stop_codon:yes gene_type:complete